MEYDGDDDVLLVGCVSFVIFPLAVCNHHSQPMDKEDRISN